MPLVDMEDRRFETERGQGADAAHPEQKLLADAVLAVARVERIGEQVDVEEVQRDGRRRAGADVVAPHRCLYGVAGQLDLDGDGLALQAERLGVDRRVRLGLAPFVAQALGEVPAAVQEPHPDERQAELCCSLQVVAREDAEAARVDRQAHVDAELHAEVRDEDAVVVVRLRPPRRGAACLLGRVHDRDEASEWAYPFATKVVTRDTETAPSSARATATASIRSRL